MDHEFGVYGLGRIGGGLALQAVEHGSHVVGYSRSGARPEQREAGIDEIKDVSSFRERLARPRVVFLYLPAGPLVDSVIDELAKVLEAGDVVVDGGNSYWG